MAFAFHSCLLSNFLTGVSETLFNQRTERHFGSIAALGNHQVGEVGRSDVHPVLFLVPRLNLFLILGLLRDLLVCGEAGRIGRGNRTRRKWQQRIGESALFFSHQRRRPLILLIVSLDLVLGNFNIFELLGIKGHRHHRGLLLVAPVFPVNLSSRGRKARTHQPSNLVE